MCDVCVMSSVKERMLSRRHLFEGVGAAAVAVTAGSVAAPSALAAGHETILDMTHELHEGFPTYFGEQQFFMEQTFNYEEHKFNLFELRLSEHVGTHMDAPLHFSADGESVAEVPVDHLAVPVCIIDIRAKAADNDDAEVTPDDIKAWIDANGAIPDKACIAMNSGWDRYVATGKFRNVGDDDKMHFPGFHVETATMLMEETGAIGLAVDTLSLDFGMSADFATHYAWLPTNRWGLECLAGLDNLPASGATLFVGAPKIRGGTGGPSRVFAMI